MKILTGYGGDLRVKENTSLTLAIDTFLNIIVKSEEPGIFRKFITALKENGEHFLCAGCTIYYVFNMYICIIITAMA